MDVGASQETVDPTDPFTARWSWQNGALSGFVATVVTGVAIALMGHSVVRETIAALYGFEGVLVAGWIAHLVHGALFGVVFAAVLADPGLYRLSRWLWKTVLAGVVYGLVLAVFGAGFMMPIWLAAVSGTGPTSIPNVTTPLLVWHLVYGAVLGGAFTVLERQNEDGLTRASGETGPGPS